MNKFKTGQKVRIKDNAYDGSIDLEAISVRGKVGTVLRERGNENGFYRVVIPDSNEYEVLYEHEIEAVEE